MEIRLFLEGLVIGFIVAVPVGPIGLLCVNRALSGGPGYGLVSGLGVAAADAIAAAVAALGLTLISNFVLSQQMWLRPIGGIFLCYLGLRIFLTRPTEQGAPVEVNSLVAAYASTFFLTLTNPVTLLSFIAIYAGWGVESLSGNYLSAAVFAGGVLVGSALWWIFLSAGLLVFREKFTRGGLRWVHRISGVIITGFGFVVLLSP